ncbi:TPA: hypothetical protein PXN07_003755 [Yersinia enterocolitica]|nr:hypothetical protein [Yersinia enterocolitica]EKN4817743.1 hypothetical protein [Yersinia enterocolitica]EKN4835038.1 hypothetical protein [Yersinia enterocolitica]CNK67498.1 Uncharacterised protein [Yersinia enterocolitica]HDL7338455.1 hypothetical protein [Yersinia enterocolitica]
MSYQYDLADFKRYLNHKNPKYRVDGLIFWQNRIPIPIDLFNQIFDDADMIITDYIYHVVASALVFSNKEDFLQKIGVAVSDLPSSDLAKKIDNLRNWVGEKIIENREIKNLAYDLSEVLGFHEFNLASESIVNSLIHKGKKYSRLYMPEVIKVHFDRIGGCDDVGKDNTDMFGNIIADRYDIYRSGFSDALAIIFNILLEFRVKYLNSKSNLKRLILSAEKETEVDVRIGRTIDGSLWEPGYEDNHFVIINKSHPLLRNSVEQDWKILSEVIYFFAEFENNQFSDAQKKFLENMRQVVSRSLWIKYDQ